LSSFDVIARAASGFCNTSAALRMQIDEAMHCGDRELWMMWQCSQ
jgi:hypothetical protein